MVWAQPDLRGYTGATQGVADIGAGTGASSGTAGVYVLESRALQVQQAKTAAIVQAWQVQALSQKCEVWQEPVVWLK